MPADNESAAATVPLVRSNPDRCAGVLAPVFSLRTEDDLGIGDVEGLRQFVDWAADAGFGFVQLLPINETGPDNSPYNAISSVALEPLTLDCSPAGLEDLPESDFREVTGGNQVDQFRSGPVRYEKVRALKLDLLWRAFSAFYTRHYRKGTDRDREFHGFGESQRKWLGDYCLFRLLMDMEGGSQVWQEWGEEFNTIDKARTYVSRLLDAEPENTERQLVYYAYVQWVALRQWKSVREYADNRGVQLMGDIPIGVSACSVDVFANPEIFDLDWYGGAPPEKLFKDDPFVQKWGQNWGIPLYRWEVLGENDFAWWRQRVEKVSEVFSLFRIDHTLGFYRIYAFPWNPVDSDEYFPLSEDEAAERCGGRRPGFQPRPDDSEENCEANRRDGEKYLQVIQEAAGDSVVIAEDLGVVPDYVRPSLAELGIPGMKVPQWEKEGDTLISGADYPEISFATYATHDHSPMKVQWEAARKKLAEAEQDSPEWWEAKQFLEDLCQIAGIDFSGGPEGGVPSYDDEIREKLFAALFETNSRYAAVMITDLLGLEERVNVPGVMDGSNWSFRLEPTVRELGQNPQWVKIAAQFRKLLIDSRRAASLAANTISQPVEFKPQPNRIMSEPINVAVTGAAGQIGYALLFRIASGAMFGPDQPVKLHLIEIEPAMKALDGVVMELDDCAFPLLHGIEATSDLNAGFKGVNWALLVGSVPRKAGMERKDLLGINGKIFTGQGQAIAGNAADDVRTLVIGNPCNTNCLIAMNNADGVPNDRWFAMTRLDENRARTQLAQKAGVHVSEVSNMTIWGNHSATQYPDFTNAKIGGAPASDAISDENWLKETFIETVQKRGAAIIEARGLSSAASAANAIVDSVRGLTTPTTEGDWNSVCVCSDGSYGIDEGLIASFPIRSDGENWSIVEGVPINEFSRGKIDATVAELNEEREAVREQGLLPG